MSKDEARLGFEHMTILVMLVPVEGLLSPSAQGRHEWPPALQVKSSCLVLDPSAHT